MGTIKPINVLAVTILIYSISILLTTGCVINKNQIEEQQSLESISKDEMVSLVIKEQIQGSNNLTRIKIGDEFVQLSDQLSRFYQLQNYKPVWIQNSTVVPQVYAFRDIISKAENEGLKTTDYHLEEISTTLNLLANSQDSSTIRNLADLDLILTDALLLYVSHLINGRIDPEGVDFSWLKNQSTIDYTKLLSTGMDSNQLQITLDNLQKPEYRNLRKALIQYKIIQANGGWPYIPSGSKIERGYRNERVKLLRQRLIISGDLGKDSPDNGNLYDDNLVNAVKNFQRRHGLDNDGIVGPSTLEALNVPVDQRIDQIKINMERYRWLPKDLGPRNIQVNIPGFQLRVIQNGKTIISMPVVVGKPYWNTPLFNAEMTYLILNPDWNIPRSIALEETLPKIRTDGQYLTKRNIKVYRDWNSGEIDPATVDWSHFNESNFNLRFRQVPGPYNPLGRIKFLFPNPYNVYLHDTPLKHLFKKAQRNFSHGCIRVEDPLGLANFLLSQETGWTKEEIQSQIKRGITQSIRLPEPIPVYLFYFTSWVEDDGTIQFRKDIYGRDKELERVFRGVS
ncbi:MAG: L,D-transpeptidase family protein [Thermodesulfobacteriota bacterium]